MPPISAGVAGVLLPPVDAEAVLDEDAGAPVVLVAPPMPPIPASVLAAPLPVADPVCSVAKDEAIVVIVVGEATLPVSDSEAVRELKPVTEELMASKEDLDARDADIEASKAASIELDAEFIELRTLEVTAAFNEEDDMVELVLEDLIAEGTLD